MHDSTLRLLECARIATAASARPVTDFLSLQQAMDISSAVLTNWKRRGVSKEGAFAAEKLFGCSAAWVREGLGAMAMASEVTPGDTWAATRQSHQPKANTSAPSLEGSLLGVVQHLSAADELTRHAIAPLLARLILEPQEAKSIAAMILAMVAARSKHAA